MRRVTTATLAMLLMAGCSQETSPDAPVFQVRDSAGITIYENSGGEWTEATAWRLSNEPTLTIGVSDGPDEYLLFQARGARRLSNGNIVIANGGTNELRFYDPDGTHVRSVGREGEGPGEFRRLGEPWPLGSDSIAVWDLRNARVTVFDIDGELGRSFRLDPISDARTPRPQGILADNSLLVTATIRMEGQRPQGIFRDSILYARYSLDGAYTATLIRRQGGDLISFSPQEGMVLIAPVRYTPAPTATVFGDHWYYGSGESWEVGVYSADGVLTHLYRRDEPRRPFTQEREDPERTPPGILAMPIPETFPAYRSFTVSDDGSFWVENYTNLIPRGPGDLTDTSSNEQPSWAVFRDDGRYLGVMATPMGAQVTHIGHDFVLVIREDELGVQQVQMYELIKP